VYPVVLSVVNSSTRDRPPIRKRGHSLKIPVKSFPSILLRTLLQTDFVTSLVFNNFRTLRAKNTGVGSRTERATSHGWKLSKSSFRNPSVYNALLRQRGGGTTSGVASSKLARPRVFVGPIASRLSPIASRLSQAQDYVRGSFSRTDFSLCSLVGPKGTGFRSSVVPTTGLRPGNYPLPPVSK
jgi:hypothetical protein